MEVLLFTTIFVAGCIFLFLERDIVKGLLRECLMFVGRVVQVLHDHLGVVVAGVSRFIGAGLSEEGEAQEVLPRTSSVSQASANQDQTLPETTPVAAPQIARVGRHHLSRIIMASCSPHFVESSQPLRCTSTSSPWRRWEWAV
jgi:hypothetical protein